jgi:hypothetical protein
MIIIKLKGGLGNQLFQYALGRYLAEIHKTVLKLDISMFESYELHTYSLWPFNIREAMASPDEVLAFTDQRKGIVERTVAKMMRRPPELVKTHIQEKHFHVDPEILDLPNDIYLDGYWQSEKYFYDIADTLRQEFTVKTLPTAENQEMAKQIDSCEAVCLHIRRGSYLLPENNPVHGICSLDYYFRCIELIAKAVSEPHFFIFSDEPQWARDNLKLSYPTTYVDQNNAEKDYEELRLMSLCKHHIIANSTFSWWGAWLCENTRKIVFAPQKWFLTDVHNTKDLIPLGWKQV